VGNVSFVADSTVAKPSDATPSTSSLLSVNKPAVVADEVKSEKRSRFGSLIMGSRKEKEQEPVEEKKKQDAEELLFEG